MKFKVINKNIEYTVEADYFKVLDKTIIFLSGEFPCNQVALFPLDSIILTEGSEALNINPFPFEEFDDEEDLPIATVCTDNKIELKTLVIEYIDGSTSNINVHDYKVENEYLLTTEDKWDPDCWERHCLIEFIQDYYEV